MRRNVGASELANSIPPFLKPSYPIVLFNAIGYKGWLLHVGVVETPLCNVEGRGWAFNDLLAPVVCR